MTASRPLDAAYQPVHAWLERSHLEAARSRLLRDATGRVLEVGAGVGENLPWYPKSVVHVDLCETDRLKRRRLKHRLAARGWPFTVAVHAIAPDGPFPDAAYNLVVATFVLSAVPEPMATAAALGSALAGGAGRLAYLDFAHAGGLPGRIQSALSPRLVRLTGGSQLDRPATAAVRSAGLVPVEQRWLRLPPPWFLAIEGQAIVRVRPPRPPS